MFKVLDISPYASLAKKLGVSITVLKNISENMSSHCPIIPLVIKGKKRHIIAPTKELKSIQGKILQMLNDAPIHPAALGGTAGNSSKSNAKVHAGNTYTLRLDIKDFFSNMHSSRVRSTFEKLGCCTSVANLLTKLTTINFHLPPGFRTSTHLANILCLKMYTNLEAYIKPKGLIYTRFVDDFTFSGSFISPKTLDKIKEIIEAHGFILKSQKEFFSHGEKAPVVTGLNTQRRQLNVPRKYKQNLRAAKHKFINQTTSENLQKQKKNRNQFQEKKDT